MAAELHLAEDALALHLLLKHLEGLSDTVVPDENLHAVVPLQSAWLKGPGERNKGCQCHPLNEAADIRMGFWFTLKFKTERFGMAFRLPFAYAFVRPESEHNCSHQRLYWSDQS
jgi:hypothetical protein